MEVGLFFYENSKILSYKNSSNQLKNEDFHSIGHKV